jgi:hypothetical protein
MSDPVPSKEQADLKLGGGNACIGNCGASVPGPNAYCEACFLKARRPAHEREPPHCASCSCPPYSPWQPIDTAPVQMDAILMTDGQWFAAGHVDHDDARKYRIYHFAVSQEYDWTPTHWMPLPTRPAQPPGVGQ